MFSHEDAEAKHTDNLSDTEANSSSSDLSADKLLLSTPSTVQDKICEISPTTPDTPVLPITPASLVNHSGLLSPGLSSPGAQSTSSGHSGGAPDPVHDLPAELLTAGWRRFWSRRERRPYFYNKLTSESRWEMPPLPGQADALTDPLGIAGTSLGSPVGSVHSRHASTDLTGTLPRKRTSSEDFTSAKRPSFSYCPFWNFSIASNIVLYERRCCHFLPPNADVELMRAQLVAKLRQNYQELCRTRESIEAPSESFNRWLLERRVVDRNPVDALLPASCPTELSPSMYREIINDIPLRLVKPKYQADARRQLVKYAEAAQRMIESRAASSENRKLVKWHAEDALEWMRRQRNASYEDYLERLAHLRRQCQPHLAEAASSSIEGICTKVYTLSCDYAHKLVSRHRQILAEHHIHPMEQIPEPPARHRVVCYPVQMATPAPLPAAVVDRKEQGEMMILTYRGDTQRLNTPYFHKLEQLYHLNCHDDPRFEQFLLRVWCLLRRYQTFFGTGPNEGFELQGALPLSVFECLNRVFGVTFECFASPLNCFFKQYCSAFTDTDSYFGSRGPLLDFYPLTGSFEANPPFCEELMEAMIDHFEHAPCDYLWCEIPRGKLMILPADEIQKNPTHTHGAIVVRMQESLLTESQEALSFIVFIPDWRDPPTEALIRVESSRFNRKQITISAQEHEYRHGFQHACPSTDLNVRSMHGTLVVFLQNDAGFAKWEPTTERLRELLLAYRPTEPLRH